MAQLNDKKNVARGKTGNSTLVFRQNLRPAVEVNWSDIDPLIIRRATDAVARAGGAIMFGRTSDRGAFSICVLYADQKLKEYPHSVDDCIQTLLAIEEDMTAEI